MKLARTTAANKLLGKAVWKATLTAKTTTGPAHTAACYYLSSLITRHYFLLLSNLLNGDLKRPTQTANFCSL